MLYEAEKGDFTLAAVGDIIATRRLNVFEEPGFLKIREILRSTDCTFANLESSIHDNEWPAYGKIQPAHASSNPEVVEDLKWLGINVVGVANNHTGDWGTEGILNTIRLLKQAQIRHGGSGRNLQEAIMPGYFDSNRGRVAIMSATSAFEPGWRAGEQRPDLQGRPGVNALGYSTTYIVDRRGLDELRRLSQSLGQEDVRARQDTGLTDRAKNTDTRFQFYDKVFELGDKFGVKTKCNPKDLENNLKWVRTAAKQADWVLVALHTHTEMQNPDMPADYEIEFAHACLNAGAHAFLGSGPHHCWPIEIYKGKPVVYGFGNFVMQLETFPRHPQEAYERLNLGYEATTADWYPLTMGTERYVADPKYWRAVFATMHWQGKNLKEIRIYPINLGQNLPWSQRCRPVMADAKVGKEILEKVQELSRPFGMKIDVRDGVGVIRV